MMLNKIIRSDGSVIDSSSIISCVFTEQVNTSVNIEPGSCSSAMIEVSCRNICPEYGERLTYFQIYDGEEVAIGVFFSERPEKTGKKIYKFTAYDSILKLEMDVSEWLSGIQDRFPMKCTELLKALAEHVGVSVYAESISTDYIKDFTVAAFYQEGITARKIFSWAAQAFGKFIKAAHDGTICFSWYVINASKKIGFEPVGGDADDSEILHMDGAIDLNDPLEYEVDSTVEYFPYYQDGISSDNIIAHQPSSVKVINASSNEHGEASLPYFGANGSYIVADNLLFNGLSQSELNMIASSIAQNVSFDDYVPMTIRTIRTRQIRAGHCVFVHRYENREPPEGPDGEYPLGWNIGEYFRVMKVVTDGHQCTFSSTGQPSYDSAGYIAGKSISPASGKDGNNGESAYDIAVRNGFIGTEEEWLDSLKSRSNCWYGTSETAANARDKLVSCDENFELKLGTSIYVKFTYAQTAITSSSYPITININGTVSNKAYGYGTTQIPQYAWQAGEIVGFVYDGTNWIMIDGGTATTSYYGVTKLSNSTSSTNSSLAATPYAVKQAYDLANTAKAAADAAQAAADTISGAWGSFTPTLKNCTFSASTAWGRYKLIANGTVLLASLVIRGAITAVTGYAVIDISGIPDRTSFASWAGAGIISENNATTAAGMSCNCSVDGGTLTLTTSASSGLGAATWAARNDAYIRAFVIAIRDSTN